MKVTQKDNDPTQTPVEAPVAETAADIYTREQHQAALTKVRQEEQERARKRLEAVQREAEAARTRAAELERQKQEAAEQVAEPMQRLELQLKLQAQEIERTRQQAAEELRLYKLQLFKREVLSRYGDALIPELVSGDTEEEIEETALRSHERYKAITQAAVEAAKPTPGPTVTVPSNPAYVQPVSLPAGVNPAGTYTAAPAPLRLDDVEKAVRTGAYAKHRDAIMAQLKASGNMPAQLGSVPLHQQHNATHATPHVEMPGGVSQPTGIPSAPLAPHHSTQMSHTHLADTAVVPQQQQPVSQPADPNDIRAQAAASIQRMYENGPIDPRAVGTDVTAQQAFAETQRFAAARGLTSQTAFAERFAQ